MSWVAFMLRVASEISSTSSIRGSLEWKEGDDPCIAPLEDGRGCTTRLSILCRRVSFVHPRVHIKKEHECVYMCECDCVCVCACYVHTRARTCIYQTTLYITNALPPQKTAQPTQAREYVWMGYGSNLHA